MYDLKALKSIPIKSILESRGIEISKENKKDLWFKLRGEKTASCHVDLDKNLWHDFGSGKGGSVIDLVAEVDNISPKEAINKLAEEYGHKKDVIKGWTPLTNSQYAEIGVQAERATLNFDFNLDKHTPEQLEKWSNKYGMHVKELAIKYPDIYNKLIEKKALEVINPLKQAYEDRKVMYNDKNTSEIDRKFLKSMAKDEIEVINRKVDLMQRALINNSNAYNYLIIDVKKDFEKDFSNKISINENMQKDKNIQLSVINAYKNLFKFAPAIYFTLEQAKAIKEINNLFSKEDNKFISIEDIKKTHKTLGNKLENLNEQYKKIDKSDIKNVDVKKNLEIEINKYTNLFNKADIAVTAIKEAVQKDYEKQNISASNIKNSNLGVEL